MAQTRTDNLLRKIEDTSASVLIFLLALIPFVEIFLRLVFRRGLPASDEYTAHLVLWITFIGGIITSREERHLSITVGLDLLKGKVKKYVRVLNAFIASSVSSAFAVSGVAMLMMAFDPGQKAGIFPLRLLSAVMPFGYLVIGYRFSNAEVFTKKERIIVRLGLLFGIVLAMPSVTNLLYTFPVDVPPVFDTLTDLYYTVFQAVHVPFSGRSDR